MTDQTITPDKDWMAEMKDRQDGIGLLMNIGLSYKAARCLLDANVTSRADVKAAILDGRLNPRRLSIGDCKRRGIMVRSYGAKTHAEVCLWAGITDPRPKKSIMYLPAACPHCGKLIDVIRK